MKLEEHEQKSIDLFGKPFHEVHQWLDEFSGSTKYGLRHRKLRHHLEGIDEAVSIFGEEVREVARQHIVDDLHLEGWLEGVHEFPKNQRHFEKLSRKFKIGDSLEKATKKSGGGKKTVTCTSKDTHAVTHGSDCVLYKNMYKGHLQAYKFIDGKRGILYWAGKERKIHQIVVFKAH